MPTVLIEPRALPPGPPVGGPRRRPRRSRVSEVLIVLGAGLGLLVTVLLAYWLGRIDGEGDLLERRRIERWENRLDSLDQAAVQLFDPDLSAPERQVIELRLEHLQRSWCQDVGDVVDEVPNHLRQAYGQVCEGG